MDHKIGLKIMYYIFLVCVSFGLICNAFETSVITAVNSSTINFAHENCQAETLSGSSFKRFYNISEVSSGSEVIQLLVRFKGISDGHILLSPNATDNDPLYLIVLGSYENRVSEIRRSKWGDDVFRMNTPGILSDLQFRGFVIRYNRRKGELHVFSDGSEMPLLHWVDKDPLDIRYFAFAAYESVVIQVAFNCKISNQPYIISPPPGPSNPQRRQSMLKNYDKGAFPNYKTNRRYNESLVTVSLPSSLTLTHFSIDEEKQTFELEAWPYFSWNDDRLKWQPENNEAGNGKIHFKPDELWLPDITVYNSAQPTNLDVYGKSNCLVSREGTITWVPPSKFVVYCDLNLRRWPKDTQRCNIKLGSWTHDSSEVDMQFRKLEGQSEKVKTLEAFKKADMEWELLETKSTRESKKFDCCPESYTSITYGFKIQRRSSLYSFTIYLPAVLISFVNLILFLQPADSAGRIMVAAVNFLVISLFLIFFRTRLPKVDHVPYIVIVYGWNLILVSLSILTAALISNLNLIIGASTPPRFLKPIYNPSFRSLLCLGSAQGTELSRKMQGTNIMKRPTEEGDSNRNFEDRSEWALLAATVDRLSFVVYATTTFVLLACFC